MTTALLIGAGAAVCGLAALGVVNLCATLRTNARVARIATKEELMPRFDDIQSALSAVDSETTRIADKLAALVAQQQAGGLTDEQAAQIQTEINAHLDALRAIGADPENPVPSAPPADQSAAQS